MVIYQWGLRSTVKQRYFHGKTSTNDETTVFRSLVAIYLREGQVSIRFVLNMFIICLDLLKR